MCKVLTLLYHKVDDMKCDKNLLAVSPDNFYKQMSYLKSNYPIVRFEQDWTKLDSDAVCITFDDGYMNNFTKALPILQDLKIPATIFVVTGIINTTEEFWWDELEKILLDTQQDYEEIFTLEDELFSCEWPTETYSEREALYDTLVWLIRDVITVEKRKNWMEQLRKWHKVEKREMNQNYGLQTDKAKWESPLLTIGAHTVNHPCLANLSEQEQYDEISQSIQKLELLLHRKITVFSYPFGTKKDYDARTINICKKEHIKKAAANFSGIWTLQSDNYQIPRNVVRNWDIEHYTRKIEEFWKI